MDTENKLWKDELDPIIFLEYTGIWSLKYEEIQNFFMSIYPETREEESGSEFRIAKMVSRVNHTRVSATRSS